MAVYVSESERPQLLPQILAQVFADIQRKRAEERSFANQKRLLGEQYEMERPTREAQLANLSASTDALRTGAENQTKARTFEEEKYNTELFLKNTIGPLLRANNIERANQLRAVYGERNSIVKGMPDFDMTDASRATGAADKWAADRATEAASGSQNPIAVDLARKLSTNEALAGPQFGYQIQAEQGPEAVAESAAIASDRAPGATPRLQAKTQKEIQSMADAAAAARNAADIASAERIAAESRASAERAAAAKAANGSPSEADAFKAEALTLVNELITHPGRENATGVSSFKARIPGSDARGFSAKIDRLKSLLTLPNLSLLKGPLSDKDIKFLEATAGALDLGIDENEFKSELERIKGTLSNAAGAQNVEVQQNKTTGEYRHRVNGGPWQPGRP